MKRISTERGKISIYGKKTTRRYLYQNRVVPVPPYRTQLVPVPIQVVPVPPYTTFLVSVPNRVVSVPQLPKCPDLCSFTYLSLK